jgi:hypothetical protein
MDVRASLGCLCHPQVDEPTYARTMRNVRFFVFLLVLVLELDRLRVEGDEAGKCAPWKEVEFDQELLVGAGNTDKIRSTPPSTSHVCRRPSFPVVVFFFFSSSNINRTKRSAIRVSQPL